ncbi:hypothetical protein M2323_004537 [Rhodoblastus acidophilus]|uniref:hypothetical protein n=1 Tax=Rhodoblastus acidophilus TaxID=1074 RepID=UPI00222436B5|nr:hypothetical protein [Rhodoblastus acidophilus]MCW2286765.1 hypothetical protein [Rhodoblastus acidophilus]MCW2335587.1 hypothetical protein [Rhodoblastus acidophilus]
MRNSAKGAADRAIQAVEARYRDRLDAVPAHVAVIDPVGRISLVSSRWQTFANDNGGQDEGYLGENYLDVCRASASSEADAKTALDGIIGVLDGNSPRFSMDYPCHSPSTQRWFTMEVAPLDPQQRLGAVISHVNVTKVKLQQLALRDMVDSIHASLADVSNVRFGTLPPALDSRDSLHAQNLTSMLHETVINAHFLAAQMLAFAKRDDFVVQDETRVLASLLIDWARDLGDDMFHGKNLFDDKRRH